ncbi:MAG: ribonuclease H-like domain-containing protein [Candidatus Dormibacteraeota bacterium]|nr:ribonuclease H-like domain-containing protein [Candidatus Dormibacteraeota bacterium]
METPYGRAWRLSDVVSVGRLTGRPPAVAHAYLDTETTGLSGGTGTQVFAVAVCRPCAAGLEICQLFLADPAGEAAFLSVLQDELRRSRAVATYNGTRFDLPLLRTRWVMARLPGELEHPQHLDLLTLTRALLRQRLESCALRCVEERILGFDREDDLPGSDVPQAYLGYLRRGWSPILEAALEHNRLDVLTLYHLHARLGLRLAGLEPLMTGGDWLALGRHQLRAGARADGWRSLRHSAELADGPASALAGRYLARKLARRGRHAAAERLLAGLHEQLPGEVALALARARLLEWRLQDLAAARGLVVAALAVEPSAGPHRQDLERRLRRLERRLGTPTREVHQGRFWPVMPAAPKRVDRLWTT